MRLVRKIYFDYLQDVFGMGVYLGKRIHLDGETSNICVPCYLEDSGVFCVSVRGDPLWFSPLPGQPWGITDIHDVLCVTDRERCCLRLMTKTGKYKGKLLDQKDIKGSPDYLCYDEIRQVLYFIDRWESDKIYFVSIKKVNK